MLGISAATKVVPAVTNPFASYVILVLVAPAMAVFAATLFARLVVKFVT